MQVLPRVGLDRKSIVKWRYISGQTKRQNGRILLVVKMSPVWTQMLVLVDQEGRALVLQEETHLDNGASPFRHHMDWQYDCSGRWHAHLA